MIVDFTELVHAIGPVFAEIKTVTRRPKTLFHYTNADAFTKILENKGIRATHIRHLNDGSEIEYAIELLDASLEALEQDRHCKLFLAKFDDLRRKIEKDNELSPPFVFCMCSEGDLLSQWREYGKGGTAYAMGFSTNKLLSPRFNCNPSLLRVEYDQHKQRRQTQNFLRACFEYGAKKHISKTPVETNELLKIISLLFRNLIAVRFKNPAFKSEHEWRLVVKPDTEATLGVQFRVSSFGITPFATIEPQEQRALPVTLVRIGPTRYPIIASQATKQFLRKHGYDSDVVTSNIPIR